MSYRDTVLATAYEELKKPVHWAVHESRILEYFRVSTGEAFTKARAGSRGAREIRSIDGNSGPSGFSPLFDMSHGKKIGYGFIYQPKDWRQLADECWFIKLTDGD
jgi:hypothetical protein